MTTITVQRRIAASPDQVFDFLVDPEKLVRWLGVAVDIDPVAGGRFHVDVTGGDVAEGHYLEVDRPRRISFTWGWVGDKTVPPGSSTVRFDLQADGGDTVVTLSHDGLPEPVALGHRAGWDYFVDRLVAASTGGSPGPVDLPRSDSQEQP